MAIYERCFPAVQLLLLLISATAVSQRDLLESFRPKPSNPSELNEFLASVLEHKGDFSFVRQQARKFQKIKKDTAFEEAPFVDPLAEMELYDEYSPYHVESKRHIHNYRNSHNRFRKSHPQSRFKRTPSPEIMIEIEGESGNNEVEGEKRPNLVAKQKKEAFEDDLIKPVHKTAKTFKGRRQMQRHNDDNLMYVDLNRAPLADYDKFDDKRHYDWSPALYQDQYQYQNYRPIQRNYNKNPYQSAAPNRMYPSNSRFDSNNFNYFEQKPHSVEDDVEFEKAQSFEIEPRHHQIEDNLNRPVGNNFYPPEDRMMEQIRYPQFENPVQKGFELLRLHNKGQNYQYPPQNLVQVPEKVKEAPKSTTSSPELSKTSFGKIVDKLKENLSGLETTDKAHSKDIKQFGNNGFIEISKTRRDESSDEGILHKNSLHPLKMREVSDFDDVIDSSDEKYQSRQLKFIDNDMLENLYDDSYESRNKDLESYPRSRRDFLSTLGMDNEDDYQSENIYKKSLDVNNTDVKNDTHIHNKTACKSDFGFELETNETSTNLSVQKSDVNDIKKILEEPTEVSETNFGFTNQTCNATKIERKRAKSQDHHFKKKKKKKRAKKHQKKHSRKTRYSDFDDYEEFSNIDDIDNEDVDKRSLPSRIYAEDYKLADKILQNKDKIVNYQASKNSNMDHPRFERNLKRWSPPTPLKPKKNVKKSLRIDNVIRPKEQNNEYQTERFAKDAESEELTTSIIATEETKNLDFTQAADKIEATSIKNEEPSESNIDDAYGKMAHAMDVENEKLAQVVNGHYASQIVSDAIEALRKKPNLRNKFYSGLSRKHVNYAGSIDFDVFKSNETEDVEEAKLLLTQITKVLNKLVVNQVRRRMCQRIPEELKEYLINLLNVKNPIESSNFIPNGQQGSFLFKFQPEMPQPPFNVKKLQETLVNLEGLLLHYHNLNQDCQNKAQPVKEYIEKHVKMLRDLVSCPTKTCSKSSSKGVESKRDTPFKTSSSAFQSDLIEKQLESVGLGKNHDFVPNFDIDQIVRSKLKSNSKRDTQSRHGNNYKSEKYRKLQLAAERIREKRENDRRLGEVFGGSKRKRAAAEDVEDVEYEAPLVYSL